MNLYLNKSELLSQGVDVIEVGYCGAQHLLTFADKLGYTAGVNGWNADVYYIRPGVLLVTGYRPFGNVLPTAKLVAQYEVFAREVLNAKESIKDKRQAIAVLLDGFVHAALKEGERA